MRLRTPSALLATAAVIGAGLIAPAVTSAEASVQKRSTYVRSVLADRPSALLQGGRDLTGKGPAGKAVSGPRATRLPNGDLATKFNGRGQFLRFASRRAFGIAPTGALTVEYWMRPDTLQFRDEEGSGYVYVLGKGNPGSHEWYGRMYSKSNQESRPNRISGYGFNPSGGLGAGSYFQDTVQAGRWIHVTLVYNTHARSSQYPTGYVKIYRNGVLRDTDSLRDYNIVPRSGNAPLRIGTGYRDSYFQGAVGDVAFYPRELAASRISAHYRAMR